MVGVKGRKGVMRFAHPRPTEVPVWRRLGVRRSRDEWCPIHPCPTVGTKWRTRGLNIKSGSRAELQEWAAVRERKVLLPGVLRSTLREGQRRCVGAHWCYFRHNPRPLPKLPLCGSF